MPLSSGMTLMDKPPPLVFPPVSEMNTIGYSRPLDLWMVSMVTPLFVSSWTVISFRSDSFPRRGLILSKSSIRDFPSLS